MDGSVRTGHHRLLTSTVANWIRFAAQLAAGFYLRPILIAGLGLDRFGIWSLIQGILAYLSLFDLGVAVAVVRYVARFETIKDKKGLNSVFSTSLCIFTAAGLAVLALSLALAFPGISWLPCLGQLGNEGRWMLLLLGANLATSLPLGVFACVLEGLGRYPAKSAIGTAGILFRSTLILVVVALDGGLVCLAAVITVCSVLENLTLAVAARYYLPELRFSLRLVDRESFRAIRGCSVHALVAMLAGRISFRTDAIVIGAFRTAKQIAFFSNGADLVEYAKDTMRVATTVLTPAVSALEAQGRQTAIRDVLVHSTRYLLWLLLPMQLGLILLGLPFLTLWLGPDKGPQESYAVLVILSLPLVLAMSQSVCARILYGLGELRWFARVALLEAGFNLLLSVLLVPRFGIQGSAWGTTIPNVLGNCAVVLLVCRRLDLSPGCYVYRSFLKPCAVAGPLALVWWSANHYYDLTSWRWLTATVAAGLTGYFLLASLVEWGPRCLMEKVRLLSGRLRQPAWAWTDVSSHSVTNRALFGMGRRGRKRISTTICPPSFQPDAESEPAGQQPG